MEENQLFNYQIEAAEKLSRMKFALLCFEMGLGKTAISIRAANLRFFKRVLILCPAVATINWRREIEMWSVEPHFEANIFSYGSLHKIPPTSTWDLLILDECHFLKSTDAKRSKQVWGRYGVSRRVSKAIWALSGTPTPNHYGELWPLLYSFGATKLSYEAFAKRYCVTVAFKQHLRIVGSNTKMAPELKTILAPVMLRKRKEEVLDLPPILYKHIVVPPNDVDLDVEASFVQYVFPRDRRHELFAKLERERNLLISVVNATKMDALKQTPDKDYTMGIQAIAESVSTLRRYTGLQKVQGVFELVRDEIKAGAYGKIVIFAIHRDVIEGLRDRFSKAKIKCVTLYGGTPEEQRQKNIDKFVKNPKCKIFIGNIHSAGTAITLTVSQKVLFAECDWTPAANAQAVMRCHRIGQKGDKVNVRFVSLADSIDERITKLLERKTMELTALYD